jgi:glycosyltransferase involved in cell wall biosynthesis
MLHWHDSGRAEPSVLGDRRVFFKVKNLTLVIPLYRNSESVPDLVSTLSGLSEKLGGELAVIAVDDGCPDRSGEFLLAAKCPFPLQVVFHSRNFGSFSAIRTGMEFATSPYLAVMAADLQEPPELVVEFVKLFENDEADVAFGKRVSRADPLISRALSTLFWSAYQRLILRDMPEGGVDIFGCNRKVVDAVLSIREPNSSLVAQLFWVGFRRKFVAYERRPRRHGKSAWSFSRRFRYLMDSIFSYSDLPILMVLWLGIFGCAVSFVFAIITVVARLLGYIQEPGYTSVVLLVIFFGSLTLAVQGIIGSYLWRAFENTKHRPLRIVSRVVQNHGAEHA